MDKLKRKITIHVRYAAGKRRNRGMFRRDEESDSDRLFAELDRRLRRLRKSRNVVGIFSLVFRTCEHEYCVC